MSDVQRNQVRRLYDVAQAGEELHVSARTVWTLIASGELASLRIGRRRLVTDEAISAFIRQRMAKSDADAPCAA
jgi:excisionase family DNA binding protein